MASTETGYKHVVLNEQGTPIIAGTTMKVIELVQVHIAYGWSPEELHFQFPYLTLGQIHSALAYYWDHQEALEQEIDRQLQNVELLRKRAGVSPLRKRLQAQELR